MMMKPLPLIPAEWAPQRAIWTAWPANHDEWNGDLASPRADVAAMVHALAPTNKVRVLVNTSMGGEDAMNSAREKIGDVAELIPAKYGDIWLRDTGPIFAQSGAGQIALRFKTNSWGGKYDLPDDATVGDRIAELANKPAAHFDFVLEGGAVDHDGQGTVLTTAQTILNPNRNGWTKQQAETELARALGAKKIIWIDEGLLNDHTDGHIDNIARFVAPGRVVCQAPVGDNDPNAETLNHIARTLENATDALGKKLEVIRIPSPGLYYDKLGEISPASHMNFIIGNGVVVVPVYGTQTEAAALQELQKMFPTRKVIGVSSKGLLGSDGSGGGSFHCITQQEPL
ncbi:MAG: agmatine deiminase family protein [Alphaproteobacteria bacterium]|nr:agmatine deiminase family protein [Alphaproteobacteria bacterium]